MRVIESASRPAPVLFAGDADWADLPARVAADPVLRRVAVEMRERVAAHLAAEPIRHVPEGHRLLLSARLFQGRVLDLAMAARLDVNRDAAARAKAEILAVAALPDWGTGHFLDVAEYALGVAVGLAWLREEFSAVERERVERALIDKALRPSFEADAFCLRWLGGRSNWTQVCHAGMVAAALAVEAREPELAEKTVRRAVADQAGPVAAYAPNGAYEEGPIYWGYGTTFHVILLSLLEKARGHDHGLADFTGFLESADYMAQVIAPSGRFYNYGDSREGVPPMPVLHWFAARTGRPELASVELRRLETGVWSVDEELRAVYARHDALAFWWRKSGGGAGGEKTARAPEVRPRSWLGRGENPVGFARTAWGDPGAAFLGIKGGRANTSHAHRDAGSFIYEASGVRWALDPGMQDYHSLESAGLQMWDASPGGDRWRIFRLGLESHNVLRFDGADTRVDRGAKLVQAGEAFVVDLSEAHRPALAQVTRRAELGGAGELRIEDRWLVGEGAVTARWQWLTNAAVEQTADGVLLRREGRALRLRVLSVSGAGWTTRIEPVERLLAPYDAACPGLTRVTFRVETAARSEGRMVVEARLVGGADGGSRSAA